MYKQALVILIIVLLMIFIIGTGVGKAEGATVEVRSGHLNLREAPNEDAAIIGKLKDGVRIEVDMSQDVLFAAVLSGNDILGWVSKSYIITDAKVAQQKRFDYLTFKVLADWEASDLPKGDVKVVKKVFRGDIVEGRLSTPDMIHLKGGGFVPKAVLEEITE